MSLFTAIIAGTLIMLTVISVVIAAVLYNRRRILQFYQEKSEIISKSGEEFLSLIQSMEETVFVLDSQGLFLFLHTKIPAFMYLNEDYEGKTLYDILPVTTAELTINRVIDVFKTGHSRLDETHLESDTVQNLWVSTRLIPQFDHQKKRVVSVLGISSDITKQKTQEIELREMVATLKSQQKTLQDLSKALIRSQEEERTRISRELHDEIGQSLTAISLNLKALQSQPRDEKVFSERLSDSHNLVKKTIDEIQRFSADLRPAILDDLGLVPACKNYIEDFRNRTGIKMSVKIHDGIKNLDPETKTVIFRTLQESLNNVVKHARADEVMVSLQVESGYLVLHVSDNGIGFHPSKLSARESTTAAGSKSVSGEGDGKTGSPPNRTGIGLVGMRERAQLVGGSCTLNSTPGSGTTITVKAPYAIA
ncbi:MAG: ATP-binding protein [Candidatus Neomarinimicrobiota bacterium]